VTRRVELRGQGASGGVAIGPAYVFRRTSRAARRSVGSEEVTGELERLRSALLAARRELEAVREKALREAGAEEAAIFDAQLLMLDDPELVGKAERAIREEGCNAEWALERAGEEVVSVLSSLPDEYLRARAADVRDVVGWCLFWRVGPVTRWRSCRGRWWWLPKSSCRRTRRRWTGPGCWVL